jgi:predicted RNase H-related nuclease YkuK (DUF458 family)
MVSGWSMHEKLTCSYFMENIKAFILTNGDKTPFFIANKSQVKKE